MTVHPSIAREGCGTDHGALSDAALRTTLMRAFWHWTGSPVDAEDLTQSTLLEAWRSARRPDDPDDERRWIFGVARNVLARWRREHGRRARFELPESDGQIALLGERTDLDAELERDELVDLLDHALATLPAESRRALLLRYVDELPQAEIARRLGISEGALESRLQRGKQAMKAHLITEQPEEAVSLGLLTTDHDWAQTRIWCPDCGSHRLVGRWDDAGHLALDCPGCDLLGGRRARIISSPASGPGVRRFPDLDRRSFKAASNRINKGMHLATFTGMDARPECATCGGPVGIVRHDGSLFGYPELEFRCRRCAAPWIWSYLPGATASHPAIQRFARARSRIRFLPLPSVEHLGRETIAMAWECVKTGRRIVALRDAETLRFRGVFDGDTPVSDDALASTRVETPPG